MLLLCWDIRLIERQRVDDATLCIFARCFHITQHAVSLKKSSACRFLPDQRAGSIIQLYAPPPPSPPGLQSSPKLPNSQLPNRVSINSPDDDDAAAADRRPVSGRQEINQQITTGPPPTQHEEKKHTHATMFHFTLPPTTRPPWCFPWIRLQLAVAGPFSFLGKQMWISITRNHPPFPQKNEGACN